MAAADVPLRTLKEWMAHRDDKTTAFYADDAPSPHERGSSERHVGSSGFAGSRIASVAGAPRASVAWMRAVCRELRGA
jgi:hypothetical protein